MNLCYVPRLLGLWAYYAVTRDERAVLAIIRAAP